MNDLQQISLSLFDLLIVIGMVTGIICSILLFRKSDKKSSNSFLALGILAFVWLNTKTLLISLNLWEVHGIGFFPNGIELALAPLFYFYFITLTQSKFKFRRRNLLHFIPFFISQAYAIVVYIAVMQTELIAEKDVIATSLFFNQVKHLEEYLTIISSVAYLYVAYRKVRNYKYWLSKNTSNSQFSELGFLTNLFLGFIFLSLYIVVNLILSPFLDELHYWRWQLCHLLIAALVYFMGLVGYKNSDIIPKEYPGKIKKRNEKGIEDVDLEILAKLQEAIDVEKVYLNPKLSLRELATMLNENEVSLSNAIHLHYNKNFRGFINDLRVGEVKNRLLSDGLSSLSLLGIAQESGFNSEASFYRIFKASTGSTPKQFLAKHT